jgi:hypothetical protein
LAAACDHRCLQAMVDAFVAEHRETLVSVFGTAKPNPACRPIRAGYTTRTSNEHLPDDIHYDICHAQQTAARISRGYQSHQPFDPRLTYVPLTAIAFPHMRWPTRWGGPLEFIRGDCNEAGDGSVSFAHLSAEKPALRILPEPNRTIIFRADLLHRATLPEDLTGVAVDGRPGGNRYSTVLRMLCVAPSPGS